MLSLEQLPPFGLEHGLARQRGHSLARARGHTRRRPLRPPGGRCQAAAPRSRRPRAGQAQLLGDGRGQDGPRGRIAGRDPARQLRIAERRGGVGDPQVAKKGQREAARERGPVDRGHNGALAVTDRLEGAGRGLDQAPAVLDIAAELARVHPGAERRARPGEDHATDRLVSPRRVNASESSTRRSIDSAFRLSGRWSVTTATSPKCSISKRPSHARILKCQTPGGWRMTMPT